MDFTEIANVGYLKQIGKIQTIAQISVKSEGASKVLAVCPSTYVRVSETLTGEVRLAGRETLDVVVLTEDGVKRETGWTDFTDRAEIEGVTPSKKVTAMGKVLDTDVVSITGGVISLASVIEITLYAEEDCNVPPRLETADGIYAREEAMTFSQLVTTVKGKAELKTERMDYGSFLCASARTCIKGSDTTLDAVEVYGEVVVDGLGVGEGGALHPFSVTLPLSEDLSAEGARRGDTAHIKVATTEVMVEEGEDGFILTVTVEFCGAVYADVAVTCATDAFSPDYELEIASEEVKGARIKECKHIAEQISGSVTLPEGENADRVLAVCAVDLSTLSARADCGKAVVEGVLVGTVIYSDAEAGAKSSAPIEMPFSITTDMEMTENDTVDVSGSVGAITVRPSRIGELTVKAELHLTLVKQSDVCIKAVISAHVGDEMPECTGSISMYIGAEGETLWDCAKALGVSPETVAFQNPDQKFPLNSCDKIFVFRNKN